MDYNKIRRKTNSFMIGSVGIGGGFPISIQSMTNTETADREATLSQVIRLQNAGCDIVRLAVPDIRSAETFAYLKDRGVSVPLVADIHFDYRIALAAVAAGADKIRINPGNIGSREKTEAVVMACREKSVPIRIGVNSGSVERSILERHGGPTAAALAESALYHLSILHEMDFYNVALSVKASNVPTMLESNRILAAKTDCPLHLGVTEAGARTSAIVKSSIGVGALLSEGIGDTIRISLTDDPVEEVRCAKEILKALELTESSGMNIVSCPTCGRTRINLIDLVREFEEKVRDRGLENKNITVALMGCVVNGPGKQREADIGIAGGIGEGLLFKKGVIVGKVPENELVDRLIEEISRM